MKKNLEALKNEAVCKSLFFFAVSKAKPEVTFQNRINLQIETKIDVNRQVAWLSLKEVVSI